MPQVELEKIAGDLQQLQGKAKTSHMQRLLEQEIGVIDAKLCAGKAVLADLQQLNEKAKTSHMRRLLEQERAAYDFHAEEQSDSKDTKARTTSVDEDSDGDSSSGDVSDPEETEVRESELWDRLQHCRDEHGMEHKKTMDVTFNLLGCLVGQYKLNQHEELVNEIMPICVKHREEHSQWYIKAIQAHGFCKYKQYKFREALDLFLEQESIMGPSAALCENIGHTQSSLGMLKEAEASFEKGVEMLKMGSFGNRGGIYLGLGLVRERLGRNKEALSVLLQALEEFKKQHSNGAKELDSSTVAKAHTSVGNLYKKLDDLNKAEDHFRSALQLFKRTVGDQSPLTASALTNLGKLLADQRQYAEAQRLLKEGLTLEVRKDAFHLDTIWEVLDRLKSLHTEMLSAAGGGSGGGGGGGSGGGLASMAREFGQYAGVIREGQARLERLPTNVRPPDEGTVAVWNKSAGEMLVMAGELLEGSVFLARAVTLLKKQRAKGNTVGTLIEECEALLQYVAGQGLKQKQKQGSGGKEEKKDKGVEELDISTPSA